MKRVNEYPHFEALLDAEGSARVHPSGTREQQFANIRQMSPEREALSRSRSARRGGTRLLIRPLSRPARLPPPVGWPGAPGARPVDRGLVVLRYVG